MGRSFDKARAGALIALLSPARRTRVVEVGSNPINAAPHSDLLSIGGCDVWGFEPSAEAFALLQPGPHETYVQAAVGDGSRGTYHLCKAVPWSSLLEPDPRTTGFFNRFEAATRVEDRIEFDTVRLDDLDEVPAFDLLKIDVQGGEMQVFEGARAKLAGVCAVISEVALIPVYKDQPLLDRQMAFLRDLGFDLHKFLFLKGFSLRGGLNTQLQKRAHANQLLDGDAVFLRSLRFAERIDDETLKHMAILADTVFESFDMALRCLEHLIERGAINADQARRYADMIPHQETPAAPAADAFTGEKHA